MLHTPIATKGDSLKLIAPGHVVLRHYERFQQDDRFYLAWIQPGSVLGLHVASFSTHGDEYEYAQDQYVRLLRHHLASDSSARVLRQRRILTLPGQGVLSSSKPCMCGAHGFGVQTQTRAGR
jgi:hypothetical protein